MIKFKINGKVVKGEEGQTVLEVARANGIDIPTLCTHGALEPEGACRICIVEVTKEEWDGWKDYVVSCVYPIKQDILVSTHSPEVIEIRRSIIELLLARCPDSPKVQKMAEEYGITSTDYKSSDDPKLKDFCILCRQCIRVCAALDFNAISTIGRGHGKVVGTPAGKPPDNCTGCGSCHRICPTGNIPMKDVGGKRYIWEKEFEMLKCKECGKSYITVDYAKALMERKGLPEEYFNVCDDCKRKKTVDTIEKLIKWNEGSIAG